MNTKESEINPVEVCDYLTYHVSREYAFVRFKECAYSEQNDVLTTVFLFDERIKKRIDDLKPALEDAYKKAVDLDVKHVFKYKQSYIDAQLLQMQVKKFLRSAFSVLTLGLTDDDIVITQAENTDSFRIEILLPKQTIEYVRAHKNYLTFIKDLEDNNFCSFNFLIGEKPPIADDKTLEKLEDYVDSENTDASARVDKTMRIKSREYYLGKPIKERPIKIKYLKLSADEQVIAGTIRYLTKREYTRASKDGEEEKKTYYTFELDDGESRKSCVYFPTTKTLDKFEKLTDGAVVCLTGVHSSRNGRVSFRVNGVSFAELP